MLENRVLGSILEKLELVSLIEWQPVSIKPIIPEGRYAVSILMIVYDSVYDEINPGYGWEVYNGVYSSTRDRKGEKSKMYMGIDLEYDFQCLYIGSNYGEYGPIYDEIKYWAYMPKMINGKLVR